MLAQAFPQIINQRYAIHEQIGRGGMGTVYRAIDRLTGQPVALKQVTAAHEHIQFAAGKTHSDSYSFRRAMAREFRTLASLRHPHIVGVMDYGFDHESRPFFTMEWLPRAENLISAGRYQPLPFQISLIVQVLQALAYLHRRGIVHRDLKPDNVLVADSTVKVVDFGLALSAGFATTLGDEVVGTMTYMAPEVVRGDTVTPAADLYALGLMAYQMISGRYPFETRTAGKLINDILYSMPDIRALEVDERIHHILHRALAKDPRERYQTAGDVMQDIKHMAADVEYLVPLIQEETRQTQESFLIAANFIGRSDEVQQLEGALRQTIDGKGSAWLIGGESGVGKSRLLEELRTEALVRGVLTISGQEVDAGGYPYQVWRNVLRSMCLLADLRPMEAAVLKSLVPDIAALVGQPVGSAPELDAQAAKERLLQTLDQILLRRDQPVLLILEDIHWSTRESLEVLRRFAELAERIPLMIVASYRLEENARLADALPNMQTIRLERLSREYTEYLIESMLGDQIELPILDFIYQETEGNTLFIIETVRALAEVSGDLAHIRELGALPDSVHAGSVVAAIQHRLSRLSPDDYIPLQFAAVIGRQIDLFLLDALHLGIEIIEWLQRCLDAGVLDIQDDRWRFAHDKLREVILADLTETQRCNLHRTIAQTIQATYEDRTFHAAALFHHWNRAGDELKEAEYAGLAGEQALYSGANAQAINLLSRAIRLYEKHNLSVQQRARWEQLVGQAYMAQGSIESSMHHGEKALRLLGHSRPAVTPLQGASVLWQIARQSAHRVRTRTTQNAANAQALLTAARACEQQIENCYFINDRLGIAHYGLLGLNLAEKAGPIAQPELARFYATTAVVCGIIPQHKLARRYFTLAEDLVQHIDDRDAISWVNLMKATYDVGRGIWQEAQEKSQLTIKIAGDLGFYRRQIEGLLILSQALYYAGRWNDAAEHFEKLLRYADDLGQDRQGQAWALAGLAAVLLRRGKLDEALTRASQAYDAFHEVRDEGGQVRALGLMTHAQCHRGNFDGAAASAEHLAPLLASSPPASYYAYEGYTGLAEFYLTLWESAPGNAAYRKQAQKAVKWLRQYAGIFDTGKPLALAYESWSLRLNNKPEQAVEHGLRAVEQAHQFNMQFEEGLALVHLGHSYPSDSTQRQEHIEKAAELFTAMDAQWELAQAEGHYQR